MQSAAQQLTISFGATKVCSTCGEQKPVEEFWVRTRNKDGRSGKCKVCAGAWHREHYARTVPGVEERQRERARRAERDRRAAAGREKVCARCDTQKPLAEFYVSRNGKHAEGRQTWCIDCHRAYQREHRQRRSAQNRAHRLRTRFGITGEEFERMREAQGGACAICERVPDHTLRVDHCHETGRVRGLLCLTCNAALGKIENVEWMGAAAAYLAR